MTEVEDRTWPETARLVAVTLDEASLGRDNAEVEHEPMHAEIVALETGSALVLRQRRGQPLPGRSSTACGETGSADMNTTWGSR